MKRPSGSIAIAHICDVPIYLHWSFPAGAFIPIAFVRFELGPSLVLCAGYVFLIAIHELGHLAAARIEDHRVFAVEISGAGGKCWTEAPRTTRAALLIFSGGLLAQLAFFIVGVIAFPFMKEMYSGIFTYLVVTATIVNAAIFAVNIVPVPPRKGGLPSDSYVLWWILKRHLTNRG